MRAEAVTHHSSGTGELEEPFLSSERSVILEDGQEGLPRWNRLEMPLAGNA